MDRRRKPRVTALLPARVWGVDAQSLPFMQVVTLKNISVGGAVIQGMQHRVRPGELLELQMGQEKAQFRVVWVGRAGTRTDGEVGIQFLPAQPSLWEMDLCAFAVAAGQG